MALIALKTEGYFFYYRTEPANGSLVRADEAGDTMLPPHQGRFAVLEAVESEQDAEDAARGWAEQVDSKPTTYRVYRYGSDGSDIARADETEHATLEAARDDVRSRLGDLDAWRRWDGTEDDIEAYHESREEGCGGVAIEEA